MRLRAGWSSRSALMVTVPALTLALLRGRHADTLPAIWKLAALEHVVPVAVFCVGGHYLVGTSPQGVTDSNPDSMPALVKSSRVGVDGQGEGPVGRSRRTADWTSLIALRVTRLTVWLTVAPTASLDDGFGLQPAVYSRLSSTVHRGSCTGASKPLPVTSTIDAAHCFAMKMLVPACSHPVNGCVQLLFGACRWASEA